MIPNISPILSKLSLVLSPMNNRLDIDRMITEINIIDIQNPRLSIALFLYLKFTS